MQVGKDHALFGLIVSGFTHLFCIREVQIGLLAPVLEPLDIVDFVEAIFVELCSHTFTFMVCFLVNSSLLFLPSLTGLPLSLFKHNN